MSTRLYLHNAANALSGTFPTTWTGAVLTPVDVSDKAVTLRSADFNIGSSQVTATVSTSATTASHDIQHTWASSKPLQGAQTVGGGTWTVNIADAESNTSANHFINSLTAYVWRPSTGASIGTIVSTRSGSSLEPTSTSSEQVSTFTIATSSVAAQDGDVIILELYARPIQSMSTSYTVNSYYDGTTENTTENAVVSSHASFVESSEDLLFQPQYTPTSGYPYVVAAGPYTTGSGITSKAIPWPSGHQAGDIGILIAGTDKTSGNTYPGTQLDLAFLSGCSGFCGYKVATSSSEPDLTITTSSSAVINGQIVLVRGGGTPSLDTDAPNTSGVASLTGSAVSGKTANSLILGVSAYGCSRSVGDAKSLAATSLTPIKLTDAGNGSLNLSSFLAELSGTSYGAPTINYVATTGAAGTYFGTISIPPAPAGSVAASSGVASSSVIGGSTATSTASSSGVGAATATGQSTATTVGSSTGVATVAGGGSQLKAAVGSVTGASTVSGTGVGLGQGVASSAGVANSSVVGKSTANSTAASSGVAASAVVGTGVNAAVASAVGTSTVQATSGSGIGVASSSGVATAQATGKATAVASASSSGTSTAQATGVGLGAGVGVVVGNANLNGVGQSTATTVASSVGVATAAAIGIAAKTAVGASAGTSTATAAGLGLVLAVGSSVGQAGVGAAGVAMGLFIGTGSAAGSSSDSVIGASVGAGQGVSVSTASTALAIAKQIGWAKGAHRSRTWPQQDKAS